MVLRGGGVSYERGTPVVPTAPEAVCPFIQVQVQACSAGLQSTDGGIVPGWKDTGARTQGLEGDPYTLHPEP